MNDSFPQGLNRLLRASVRESSDGLPFGLTTRVMANLARPAMENLWTPLAWVCAVSLMILFLLPAEPAADTAQLSEMNAPEPSEYMP